MINRTKDIIDSIDLGRQNVSSFRKVSSQATTAGVWADLSMASGNPSPNFYSGIELTATTLEGSKGMYYGNSDFIFETLCYTTTLAPLSLLLCDYLLFYPQVDMDSVDTQQMDNTVALPRYTSGEGVRMFIVAQYPYIGGATFNVTYTNSDGVQGRTTGNVLSNTAVNIASFIHGTSQQASFGCFLPLQGNDKGVRAVESITFNAPNGGLASIVLVKPLYSTLIRENTAVVESNTITDSALMPKIEKGAYLNFITLPNGSIAGQPITGLLKTIW
jgi:hypothetical protein